MHSILSAKSHDWVRRWLSGLEGCRARTSQEWHEPPALHGQPVWCKEGRRTCNSDSPISQVCRPSLDTCSVTPFSVCLFCVYPQVCAGAARARVDVLQGEDNAKRDTTSPDQTLEVATTSCARCVNVGAVGKVWLVFVAGDGGGGACSSACLLNVCSRGHVPCVNNA